MTSRSRGPRTTSHDVAGVPAGVRRSVQPSLRPRLRGRGMPHQWAPDKEPVKRVKMIAEAGELAIPFTTGILVGIGETERERMDSLLAIRALHERYGHIQEVIVQNFRAKPNTPMCGASEVDEDTMIRTVALARLVLGGEMNLQAPPNLSPGAHRRLIRAGINDWGGISPVTLDYVNPEARWPHIDRLRETCEQEGFRLSARLPIYDRFIDERFVDARMLAHIRRWRPRAQADMSSAASSTAERSATR